MTMAISASVGIAAYGAISSNIASSAQAAFSEDQVRYNNTQNAKHALLEGSQVDTNTLRARTEATATLQSIDSSANEAIALARVGAAASNIGAGSYDTVINTFAKKTNQAKGGTMQQLISELVGNKLTREDIAVSATNGQQTNTARGASPFSSIMGGVANYFSMTKGLSNAFGSWGGSSSGGVSSASFQSVGDTFAGTNATSFGASAFTE